MRVFAGLLMMSLSLTLTACDGLDGTSQAEFEICSYSFQDVSIVRVTADGEAETQMYARFDTDGSLVGLRYGKHFASVAEINRGAPLLRDSERKLDVIRLVGKNISATNGGPLVLDYLKNALTGSRGSLSIELNRFGERWQLFTNSSRGRNPFSRMHLNKNFLFGQAVGISNISVGN
jgi:hypothetical protein